MEKKRVIAIYLPQYHPVIENDKWWGKGFTEWTNVTKAKPLFRNHYQPHLPSDLGFYDLRVPETRELQANIAKAHGIDGFCYYHYWFNGKRILERPFNEVVESGTPNFPFMLCWANENWTRAWDGGEKEILLEQKYSEEDDRRHIKYLINNVFNDPRYIRVDNKPVFIIYRSTLFPDIKQTIKNWREEARKCGMELYLCRMESFAQGGSSLLDAGFDAAVDFQPLGVTMSEFLKRNIFKRIVYKLNTYLFNQKNVRKVDYSDYVKFVCNISFPLYKRYPCVTPMWDNTARRKENIFMFVRNSPSIYGRWLESILYRFRPYTKDENFVFINAWNEWAEGNHLEADIKWKDKFLIATKDAVEKYNIK